MPTGASIAAATATPVFTYTRQQALQDGLLIDVSADAQEAGFTIPMAVTRRVFENCIEWSEQDARKKPRGYQDQNGRQWDVIWMAAQSFTGDPTQTETVYQLRVLPRPGHGRRRIQTLKLKIDRSAEWLKMMQILAQKNFAGLIDFLEPIAIRAHTWTRNYEAEHNLSPLPPLGIRPSTVPTANCASTRIVAAETQEYWPRSKQIHGRRSHAGTAILTGSENPNRIPAASRAAQTAAGRHPASIQ